MSDERKTADLETTAREAWRFIPHVSELTRDESAILSAAEAAVRELGRQAAGAQTLRDALEQIEATPPNCTACNQLRAIARAVLATPDTPPWEEGEEQGVCINCGASMDFNPNQPWCEKCIEPEEEEDE